MRNLRHPRTLNEAFGPYADHTPISDPVTDAGHVWTTVICTVLSVLFFLAIVGGAL